MAGMSMDQMSRSLGSKFDAYESKLEKTITEMDPNNPKDMIEMQRAVQKWRMMSELQSTMVKQFGDVLRGIIQKSG